MQWVEYLGPSDMRYYRHMFSILHNGSLLKKRASTVSQDKHKNVEKIAFYLDRIS